jgi:dolichol-phosphate mannosyltransferase
VPDSLRGPATGATWVVVPTYNEADTIETLVREVRRRLPASRRILVVDDASPDGTGAIVDRLGSELGDVSALHRTNKAGLGPAYIAGFREALAAGAELIVQMDADLSHDPDELPRLLAAADEADLVLGSRYVPGGRVTDWGPVRQAISRWGSRYARAVLGIPIWDLTGGFKVFRRAVLETIDLETIESRGYAFQIELTWRAIRRGFRVVEVPITFRDRRVGASKMSRSIVAEAIWRVPAMRFRAAGAGFSRTDAQQRSGPYPPGPGT